MMCGAIRHLSLLLVAGMASTTGGCRASCPSLEPSGVQCGSARCEGSTPICCFNGSVTSDGASCVGDSGDCGGGGLTEPTFASCEKAADCASGELCCASWGPVPGTLTWMCATDCFLGDEGVDSVLSGFAQVCQTSCECQSGPCSDAGYCLGSCAGENVGPVCR